MTFQTEPKPPARRLRLTPKLAGAIAATVLVLVFILQNTERGTIDFLWISVETGIWAALLVTFVAGVFVGWLLQRFVLDKN